MMKTIKAVTATVFFAIILFTLFVANIFASKAEFEAIEKLSEAEKAVPQEKIKRPLLEYKAGNFRDPFQPPVLGDIVKKGKVEGGQMPETPPPSLTMQGVIWGGRFPQAIINNKVVKAGDAIEGARIISIDKDGATLFFKDRQYNLASPAGGGISYEKSQGGKYEK